MTKPLTPTEAKAWKNRWKLVNAHEVKELRNTPLGRKLQQIAALMASVDCFGWRQALAEGVHEVRNRWIQLKRSYGVPS